MTDTWAAQWAQAWTGTAQRFNQNHAPAGSATGGQFTTSGGGGGGASKTSSSKNAGNAARKARLRAQAKADRAKAAQLQQTLNGLLKKQKAAQAHSAAAAKAAKAKAAAAGHINPHAKKATPGKGKSPAAHATAKHHASLKKQIASLKQQISTLLAQAAQLDAQAAKL